MRVVVLGAGGRLGSRVLAECVRQGHQATAFVRSAERLRAAVGPELLERVAVVEGDVLDAAKLRQALRGQEACVQASGYIGSTYEESKPLQQLVQAAVEAANETLVGARRLWVLGGAAALDLPGRPGTALVDVPGFPLQQYRIHLENYRFLKQPEFAGLDWSLACPGSMYPWPAAAAEAAAAPAPARVVPDQLPFALPCWAAALPTPLLLPALAAIKGRLTGPSYEEVAAAMVAHLAPGGPLRQRRAGFAGAGAEP